MVEKRPRPDPEAQNRAIGALREMNVGGSVAAVETLKLGGKSKVHRVHFENGRPSLIVKLGYSPFVARDIKMFEFLRAVGCRAPTVLGVLPASDSRSWVVTEDAGDQHPDLALPAHQHTVSRWIAQLHVLATPLELELPIRGLSYYVETAKSTSHALRQLVDAVSAEVEVEPEICELSSLCADAARLLLEATAVAEEFPATLVHGDFVAKNLLIEQTSDGAFDVICLDWETAGIGSPAPDMARVDHAEYLAVAGESWRDITLETVNRQASLGILERLVQAVAWELNSFAAPGSRDRARANLLIFHRRFEPALAAVRAALA